MRILVIEDNPVHLDDARRLFADMSHVQADYVSCFYLLLPNVLDRPVFSRSGDGPRILRPVSVSDYDGVISDIFFPQGDDRPYDQPEPCGVGVLMMCHAAGVPCVLNTAGWHHGDRYDWICQLQRQFRLPEIVDAQSRHEAKESDHKNWAEAYRSLAELIRRKR